MTDATTFLEYVARVSESVAWQAGVGACETAGAIISYLSAHPSELDAFMADGFFALGGGERIVDHHREGRLSWMGMDGKVWSPEEANAAVAAKAAS